MRNTVAVVLVLAGAVRPLAAQSSATISDIRIITEKMDGAPDTTVLHTISSGVKNRTEVKGKTPNFAMPFPGVSAGIQLSTMADSDVTIDYLDSTSKTYWELKPLELMKTIGEMVKSLGGSSKWESVADSSSLDSLGDGGVINGYSTFHFRSHSRSRITTTMMGQSYTVSMSDTTDTYVSPQLKKEWDGSRAANVDAKRFTRLMEMLTAGLPTGADSMMGKARPNAERLLKSGMPVRTITDTRSEIGELSIHQRQTMDILKLEKAVVADSLFVIPPGYKKVDSPVQMPQMPTIPPGSAP